MNRTAVGHEFAPGSADRDDLREQQLDAILSHVVPASVIATSFALVLALYLAPFVDPPIAYAWFALKLAAAMPRFAVGLMWRRGIGRRRHERVQRWLMISLGVDGAVWGLTGVWASTESTETAILVLACLAGVSAVAALGLQVRVRATAAFVCPILVPLSVAFLLRTDSLGVFGASAALTVLVQTLIAASNFEMRMHREFAAQRQLAKAVADRSEVAEERARVAALREVVLARSTFLAKVSHELRSPIQGIVSALDVLDMRRDQPIADNDELVSRIRRSSVLLNTQVRDLLTLAKGEAGQLSVYPEAFDAAALVLALGDAAVDLASAKGLSVRIEVPPHPVFVVADGPRIDQILTNLVVNSVRSTDRGEVRVILRPFVDRMLVFEVADTGPGMPAEVIPTLTGSDPPASLVGHRGEGSGLGLAIVRTLVDLLGGSISIPAPRERGSTVVLNIPAEPAATDAHASRGADETGRMLIVDDREDVCDALSSVGSELGYECDTASSAAVAANLLAARRYDAVLLDIEMPIRSGAETAAEARRAGALNEGARFIGMSAGEVPDAVRRTFDAWLTKPISRGALRQALGMVDSGFRPSQPGLWAD